ncbi:glucose 1-dehydrogenase [Balneolales bacterium ANBcel1]|nr:glucose 1-dehydrogenase [Balneolales bacterium ANBcel1]
MADLLSDIKGKRILITGGGSGLGLSMARTFAQYGARVIITDLFEDKLKEVVADIEGDVSWYVNDITELDQLPGLVEQIESEKGPIEVLVNNCGINMKKPMLEVTDEEFQRILKTNLNGAFALTREVARFMTKRKKGSIINITSMASIYGIPGVAAYTASKSAILGLTRSMAVDLSPSGIRVNAIAPGFIDTPMSRRAFESDPERRNKVIARTPMQILGVPQDIANAAMFLASDASGFISGVNLPVDGGNSIGF